MDRLTRFFAWVWRLNGLFILLVIVGGLVAVIGSVVSMDRPEEKLTRVAGTDLAKDDLRLSGFAQIEGTRFLYAALHSSSSTSPYSATSRSAHNLLFLDTESKAAHWLLSGSKQKVYSWSFLFDPPLAENRLLPEDDRVAQEAVAILLELRSDRGRRLAVATPDGREVKTIAESVETMLGYHHVSANSVFVFYVSDGAARILDLDPISRVARSDDLLSTVQGSASASLPQN